MESQIHEICFQSLQHQFKESMTSRYFFPWTSTFLFTDSHIRAMLTQRKNMLSAKLVIFTSRTRRARRACRTRRAD